MVVRFPQDCWDKECPYFTSKYLEEENDTVCKCKLLSEVHSASNERRSFLVCPRYVDKEEV